MKVYYILLNMIRDIKACIKIKSKKNELIKAQQAQINKWMSYTQCMYKWYELIRQGGNVAEYLIRKGYKRVVIYGFIEMGKYCYDELEKNESVEVICFADKMKYGEVYKGKSVISPSELSNIKADAVIIAPINNYTIIAGDICDYTEAMMVCLEDMILGGLEYAGEE